MKNISIIGGGISGLAAALYLSKQGHAVTVLEKDHAPLPESAEQAFAWDRRGAPQVRHSHGMLARLRNLLHEDHPEVLKQLLNAGATEMRLYEQKPRVNGIALVDDSDKELVMLACRRTTLEWVLRTAVLELNTARFRSGTSVKGFTITKGKGEVPTIDGVILDDGSKLASDLVIAADGRRSSVPKWLSAIGISLDDDEIEPAGIVYFSRFYRLNLGSSFPSTGLVAGDIGYLSYAAFCGDNDTYSITLSINEDDERLRRAIQAPDAFETAARVIPELAPWVASGTAFTDVFPMSGLINRRRHFLLNGKPVVKGLHTIGDAHICTNPAYGRGLSTGFWQARFLAEAIATHPVDLIAQGMHFSKAIQMHIVPWFDSAVMMDSSKRLARHNAHNNAGFSADNPMRLLSEVASIDPMIWRSFWRTMNLLEPPTTLMAPEFLERFASVSQNLAVSCAVNEPQAEPLPDHDGMLNLLSPQDSLTN